MSDQWGDPPRPPGSVPPADPAGEPGPNTERDRQMLWIFGALGALVVALLVVVLVLTLGGDDGGDDTDQVVTDATPSPEPDQPTPTVAEETPEPTPDSGSTPEPATTPTVEPTAGPTPTPLPTSTPTPTPSATPEPTTTPEPTPVTPRSPQQAADLWVQAAATGDTAQMWHLLGPASRAAIGSENDLEDLRSELAEGWGAWDSADDAQRRVTELDEVVGRTFVVVTFTGEIAQEGPPAPAAAALPMVAEDGQVRVEPFAFDEVIEFVEPDFDQPPAVLDAEGPIVVRVPDLDADVWGYIDGKSELDLEAGDVSDDTIEFTADIDPAADEGVHVLTIVYRSRSAFHAAAVLFDVTG